MPPIRKCSGKENIDRINYLYQMANIVGTDYNNNVASRIYSSLLIAIAKKTVQRLDVRIKRTICKACRFLLVPGINCKVRLKKKQLLWTCLTCHATKKYNMRNKDYQLWTETPESIVEILDYKNNEIRTE